MLFIGDIDSEKRYLDKIDKKTIRNQVKLMK